MLPDISAPLSAPAIAADFLAPHDVLKKALVDYARGGVAIGDPTQGHDVKTWKIESRNDGFCKPSEVYISAPDIEEFLLPDITGNVTSISFAFDQNMQPAIVYTLGWHNTFLYWWNSATSAYETLSLGAGLRTPILRLDDVKETGDGVSELILSYTKGDCLFVRLQRDRYGVEYLVDAGGYRFIAQCGMSAGRRFQWACG